MIILIISPLVHHASIAVVLANNIVTFVIFKCSFNC